MQTKFAELSDSQWQFIEKFFGCHRPKIHSMRTMLNAILWLTRTGTQWRNLESRYPKWESVYYYYRIWKASGLIDKVCAYLVESERKRLDAQAEPSIVAIDSQSVKCVALLDAQTTGIDAGKKVNGRKRHLVVDKFGLLIAVFVTRASVHDAEAGIEMLWQMEARSKRIECIYADGAYNKSFREIAESVYFWQVECAQRPPGTSEFVPQKGRWQIERSFGWLNFFRRLNRDYEKLPESHAAFIQLAFISIILNRICR